MKNVTTSNVATNNSISVEYIPKRTRSISKRGFRSYRIMQIHLSGFATHEIRVYDKLASTEGEYDYLYRIPWGLALVKGILYRNNGNDVAADIALDAVLTNSTVDNLATHIAATYRMVYGFDEFELVNQTISDTEFVQVLRGKQRELTRKMTLSDLPEDFYDTRYVERVYARKVSLNLKDVARQFVFEKAKPYYPNLSFHNLASYVSIRIASEYTASLRDDSIETLLSYCKLSRAKATRAFTPNTIRAIRLAFGYDYRADEEAAKAYVLARKLERNPHYGMDPNLVHFYKMTGFDQITNDEIISFVSDLSSEFTLTDAESNAVLSWLIVCKKNATHSQIPDLPESFINRYERGREGGMTRTKEPSKIFRRFRADVVNYSNTLQQHPKFIKIMSINLANAIHKNKAVA